MSSRETVRRACKVKIGFVEVDGERLYVRSLSGRGRHIYTQLFTQAKAANASVESHVVVALGLCDEQGQLIYRHDDDADLNEVLEFDGAVLDNLAVKVFELSGLTKEAQAEAEKK